MERPAELVSCRQILSVHQQQTISHSWLSVFQFMPQDRHSMYTLNRCTKPAKIVHALYFFHCMC